MEAMSKAKFAVCPLSNTCPESPERRELLHQLAVATTLAAVGGAISGLSGCASSDSSTIGALPSVTIPNNPMTNNYTLSFDQFPTLRNNNGTASVIVQATSATQTLYVTRVDANQSWAVSTICTHAGTVLNSWDPTGQDYYCSTHAARFKYDGTVEAEPSTGASTQPLTAYQGTISAAGITFSID